MGLGNKISDSFLENKALSLVSVLLFVISLVMFSVPQAEAVPSIEFFFPATPVPIPAAQYEPGSIAIIQVDDSGNLTLTTNNKTDTITIALSTQDPFGTPVFNSNLELTETGTNTGIFRSSSLIFVTGPSLLPANSVITVNQDEVNDAGYSSTCSGGAPITSATVDSICASIYTRTISSTSAITSLTLNETNATDGHFIAKLRLTSSLPTVPNSQMSVKPGDVLSIEYLGAITNSLITPLNPGQGEIIIAPFDGIDDPIDTLTASYGGMSGDISIAAGVGEGGGGGGGL